VNWPASAGRGAVVEASRASATTAAARNGADLRGRGLGWGSCIQGPPNWGASFAGTGAGRDASDVSAVVDSEEDEPEVEEDDSVAG
jgi:hypothetical protein